ncbi:hypothetical protein GY45DRAFT_607261 [Cubamyces sp. BRFM 1775]|nr:hypothetical protein GY45DRAFT_607261 [Cubamyces sp. BRFM 1775]
MRADVDASTRSAHAPRAHWHMHIHRPRTFLPARLLPRCRPGPLVSPASRPPLRARLTRADADAAAPYTHSRGRNVPFSMPRPPSMASWSVMGEEAAWCGRIPYARASSVNRWAAVGLLRPLGSHGRAPLRVLGSSAPIVAPSPDPWHSPHTVNTMQMALLHTAQQRSSVYLERPQYQYKPLQIAKRATTTRRLRSRLTIVDTAYPDIDPP